MAEIKHVEFYGSQKNLLAGRIHLPIGRYRGAALFAHCFTCSKDIMAARQIATGLATAGIAVLRFDFTGLGQSQGDFSQTSFSSNLEDLIAASEFMSEQFFGTHRLVPQLLVGHSLGGAAVLSVAADLPSVRAVATIAAPAFAGHVMHLFSESMDEIKAKGKARLAIGGRPFTVGAQLVNDLNMRMTPDYIASLTKDLLILHGPLDEIVSIDHAAMIFAHAKHPKSFVSLNRADHLLSRPEDARFAADMIASWARRCLPDSQELTKSGEGDVWVRASPDGLFAHDIITGSSVMRADEPTSISGGLDSGPPPYDFLLAGLGACTAMTLRLYARNKNWPLTDVDVHLSHKKSHASDSLQNQRLDVIDRAISLKGPLSAEQKARLMEIADKCPVHKSLQTGLLVQTRQV